MDAPGGLDDLGVDGRQAWTRRVNDCIDEISQGLTNGPNRFVTHPLTAATPHRTAIDWTGLPARLVACVTRARALELLDWTAPRGNGRVRRLQEEYLEWRVVRDDDGIRRVELTTELSDYWRVLAAHEPQRALDLVAEFAGDRVDPAAVYRDCDPFDPATTPEQREAAFEAAMLSDDDPSPYNDGTAAITCMVQRSNTLAALAALVLVATEPRVMRDLASGKLRCLTCDECIPLVGEAAQAGRLSDPVLVERVSRLAFEGRLAALDDPVGVYIQGVEHTRLRTPFGEVVPPAWFTFDRGSGPAANDDGRPRWQRLTLEAPAPSGLRISDLVDVATEQPIQYGGQIADLVQVAVVLRVSDANVRATGLLEPTELKTVAVDEARGYAALREHLEEYLAEASQ